MKKITEEEINIIKNNSDSFDIDKYVCSEYELSEDFIREFKDKVDWECIFYYQDLSEDFIKEFQNKAN